MDKEWKPEIIGRNIEQYCISVTGQRWVKYGPWLAAARDPNNFIGKRLLVQEITGGKDKQIIAAYCDEELYHSRDVIAVKFDAQLADPFFILCIINSKLITWYHHKRNPKAQKDLFPKVLLSDLKNLPIKQSNYEDRFSNIVSYINLCKRYSKSVSFFETLINAMVYELYLPKDIKAANAEVLKHLNALPELKEEWSDEKKLRTIEKVYEELSSPNHPVSIAMFKMDTIEEIRIIEGKQ